MSKKTFNLLILRHAKSDWGSEAPSDFQRPLNKRGRKAAQEMGEWLTDTYDEPLTVLSSSALRAWQTSVIVSQALEIPEQNILFNGNLYLASVENLVSELQKLNSHVKNVILVG
ncbi:MAG: histidine phosphatase family protein, partial [Gammaproteobacteria bacterium]|nr:histidine phosphatase family protein [Gammaproteobacteria bacterium]